MRTRLTRPAPLAPQPRSPATPLSVTVRVRPTRALRTRETGGMRSTHVATPAVVDDFPPVSVPAAWPALAVVMQAAGSVSRAKYAEDEKLSLLGSTSGRLYGSPG